MCGTIHPLPQYALMAWCSVKAEGQLYLNMSAVPSVLYGSAVRTLATADKSGITAADINFKSEPQNTQNGPTHFGPSNNSTILPTKTRFFNGTIFSEFLHYSSDDEMDRACSTKERNVHNILVGKPEETTFKT
jgi:hypothetical protein